MATQSFNYSRLQNTSDRLIRRYGGLCILRTFADLPAPNAYDPPIRTTVDTDIYGAFVRATEAHADGQLIHVGDQLVLISPLVKRDLVNIKGEIHRGNEVWKIVTIKPLNPGGTDLLFKAKVQQ